MKDVSDFIIDCANRIANNGIDEIDHLEEVSDGVFKVIHKDRKEVIIMGKCCGGKKGCKGGKGGGKKC